MGADFTWVEADQKVRELSAFLQAPDLEQNLGRFKAKGAVECGGDMDGKNLEGGGWAQATRSPAGHSPGRIRAESAERPSGGNQQLGGPAEGPEFSRIRPCSCSCPKAS